MTRRFRDHIDTPVGRIALVVDEQGRLNAAGFVEGHLRPQPGLALETEPADDPCGVSSRLRAYFAGDLQALDELDLALTGTVFQRQVWAALREIPPGRTWSYGRLASHMGRPKAVRAVGSANAANPAVVIVPCHRVIGADGALSGYAGGVGRKVWLLTHEGVDGPWQEDAKAEAAQRWLISPPAAT